MEDERETAHLRQRRHRSSPMNLSCCFHGPHSRLDFFNPSPSHSDSEKSSPTRRSSSSWFRSKGTDQQQQQQSQIRGRRRNFMARLGRHPRRHSADFSYDPLSYALNFDTGSPDESVVDQDFLSRLPVSPPRVRPSRPRCKDLDLPSPRSSGRKKVESPMKPKIGMEGSPTAGRKSSESPMAAHGRKSSESPTAAHGRRMVQSPTAVPADSPKAAIGLSVDRTRAAGPREIFVEQ